MTSGDNKPHDHKPHDKLFRRTFGNPRHAEGVFRTLLPGEVVARADWSRLKLEEGTYVDEELKQRQSDVLFSVPLGGRPALLYLLFEHQSSADPHMPLRMLRYLVRIWDRWVEAKPGRKAAALPAVIPMVLYHGDRPWTAATELREIIDLAHDEGAAIEAYLPRWRILLDDLTALREEELLGRQRLSTMAKLAQALLRSLRHERVVRLLARLLDLMREVERDPAGLSDFRTLIYYVWEAGPPAEWTEVEAFMQANMGEKVGIEVRSIADVYRAEGWAKGRAEGHEKGREEGRAEGHAEGHLEAARHAVLAVFEARGLRVPDAVRDRITSCSDLDMLAVWLKRAVDVAAAAEIFDQ